MKAYLTCTRRGKGPLRQCRSEMAVTAKSIVFKDFVRDWGSYVLIEVVVLYVTPSVSASNTMRRATSLVEGGFKSAETANLIFTRRGKGPLRRLAPTPLP